MDTDFYRIIDGLTRFLDWEVVIDLLLSYQNFYCMFTGFLFAFFLNFEVKTVDTDIKELRKNYYIQS